MRPQLRWFGIAVFWLIALRTDAARNVTISTAPTTGGSFNAGFFVPTADDANVFTNDIDALLGSGISVTISTGNTGTQAGNITVAAAIAPPGSAAGSLTLNAAGSVALNAPVTLGSAGGNLLVSASGPISQTAALIVHGASVLSSGSSITLTQANQFTGAITFD